MENTLHSNQQYEDEQELMDTAADELEFTAVDNRSSKQTYSGLPPVNNSMDSFGNSTVIIIKVLKDAESMAISKPAVFCEEFERSLFSKTQAKEIRTNKRKGVFVIELEKKPEAHLLQEILKMDKLGSWDVECYIPNREKYKYGVIYPVDIETDLNVLQQRATCENAEIVKMERLTKKIDGRIIPAESVRVTVDATVLPSRMKIGFLSYTVRPFVVPSLQCCNCQMIGHTAGGCTRKQRCLLCSGEHAVKDCKSRERTCANCKGNHSANSSQCKLIMQAKTVEKGNAYKQFHQSTTQNTYASIVKGRDYTQQVIQTQQAGVGTWRIQRQSMRGWICGDVEQENQNMATIQQIRTTKRTIGVQTAEEVQEKRTPVVTVSMLQELKKFIMEIIDKEVLKLKEELMENRRQIA